MAIPAESGVPAGSASRWVTERAAFVLAAIAAISLGALSQLFDLRTGQLRLTIDPSLDPLIAQDSPERQYYDQVRHRFGSDELVLVVMRYPALYSSDALQRLYRMTQALNDLPGVTEARSLTSVALPLKHGDDLHFEQVRRADLDDPGLPARLRASVETLPLLRGQLVSADGRAAVIAVSLDARSDLDLLDLGIIVRITAAAAAGRTTGVDVWITGAPVIRAATSRTVMRQMQWIIPATIVLLTVLLALAFRNWRGVLLPLATILLALIWTFATLTLFGRPLNLITSLVPPLIVTLGLAYCAHVLSEFEALAAAAPQASSRQCVRLLLHEVAGPVVLTGITSSVCLLALALTDLPAIRDFALLSSLGVLYTMVLVLSFVPAALSFTRPPKPGYRPTGHRLFEDASRWLGRFDRQRRRWILAAACIVFVLAVLAALNIRIGDRFVGIFHSDSAVRADYDAVNRAIGGVNPLTIAIDGPNADTFAEPRILRALGRLQDWLSVQPEVGSVTGLVDHARMLGRLLDMAGEDGFPASSGAAQQMFFFGDGPQLRGVVNADRSSSLIRLRLRVDDTAEIAEFLRRLQPQLMALPRELSAQVTGSAALMTQSVALATTDQLRSIGLALLLVFLCLTVQFASWSAGFLATLPTLLQTAIYFGALGVFGVQLNATTGLVEVLVLGLAIDDTIHYLARFNSAAKRTGSESEAAVSALAAVLRPVTMSKGILLIGFLVLTTGELRNQVLFGWLAAFTLASAWLVDTFVTPAFMAGLRIVTLWDVLRLNLGRDVQTTIPLFAGLSSRQARIFALMSNLQTVPAGTRLISEGDPGGDVYVVIDGTVSIWKNHNGSRLDLTTLMRGAIIGEIGYFGQRRTANVDAVSPVRVLRFDDADQEHICRRYPHIAARVFLNLNRLQAERRAASSSTGRPAAAS